MTRSWKTDRRLVIFTTALLLMEVAWLLLHLQVIPNPFQTQKKSLEQKPAGYVMKTERELRKREMNSLMWENSGDEDVLHYYDSVLTLSQSTAVLHLHEQTEVRLSENTLVTIEPQSESENHQIRLKFTRGDLRARNPFAATQIQSDQWSLQLAQGSEVSLRQTGDDDFEVEVLKGQLQFEKDSSTQSLSENQVLKIEDNKAAGAIAVSENVKFEGPAYQRIYSHQARIEIPVTWQGDAQSLQVSPLGKTRSARNLASGQRRDLLSLESGKYTLRLLKDGEVSESKELEVWQAPPFHLLSPFPRDRVKTNQQLQFVWSSLTEAHHYKFVVKNLRSGDVFEKTVSTNTTDHTFTEESDFEWKVIALDRDGFEILPPYGNQIFPRHEPFAAPKLKSPELRLPASKPDSSWRPERQNKWSWFFRWLLPYSRAADSAAKNSTDYEAVFAWEPVNGADLYTIEISASSDFRNPLTSKTVKRTEFIWSKFNLGTYYWRVAAGASNGRMGVFSEPAKVELKKLPDHSSDMDGVLVRRKIPDPAPAPPPEVIAQKNLEELLPSLLKSELQEPQALAVTEAQKTIQHSYLLEWAPLYVNWSLHGDSDLEANLTGSSSQSFHLQVEQRLGLEGKTVLADFFFSQFRWVAKDPLLYPFQSDQTVWDSRLSLYLNDEKSTLLRGATVQALPVIERKDLEEIEITSAWALGPSVEYKMRQSENWTSSHSLSALAGSQIFALSTQNRLRYQALQRDALTISLGLQLQLDLIFQSENFSRTTGAGATVGIEF